MRTVFVILISLLLSACGTTSSSVDTSEPMPIGYLAASRNALRASLKNPYDVRDFKIGAPFRVDPFWLGYIGKWAVCASLRSRNSFNAMVPGTFIIFFENNRVVKIDDLRQYRTTGRSILTMCGPMVPVSWS